MVLTAQNFGLLAGWIAVGWVAVQAAIVAVRAWRREVRTELRLAEKRSDFRRRVDMAARVARATHAIPDWQDWRPFRVGAVVDEAREVKSFYLTPVDGKPLAPFAPGQYLTFRLPLAGGDLVRCYSLSDRPREDYYRVTIKRVAAPVDRPELAAGRGSGYFHDRVRVGDVLESRAPAGTFLLDPLANEPVALIGSGIGITPLVSMLDAIVHSGRRRDVYALFGFRCGRDQPFREYLQKIAQNNPNVRLHVSYSAPRGEDVHFRDYNHCGRMMIERVRDALPANNFRFYVCGPGEMMETLVPALWEWGVPESHVHFEAFGPASVKRLGAHAAAGAPCDVRFAQSGRDALWDGTHGSLLEFGEAAGVVMPSGCRAGSCGECATAIRRGNALPLKLAGVPVPEGHCLTCISVPAGDLVLDI